MLVSTRILAVEQDGVDGVFVTFSDGTSAGYLVEELLELRPKREPNPDPPKPRGLTAPQ